MRFFYQWYKISHKNIITKYPQKTKGWNCILVLKIRKNTVKAFVSLFLQQRKNKNAFYSPLCIKKTILSGLCSPWTTAVNAWWGTPPPYSVSQCFPAGHLQSPKKNNNNKRKKKQWTKNYYRQIWNAGKRSILTFFGQMMCGANIVARLMADILLTCWLRAVWCRRSSSSFKRLRLAAGSSMKSSWNASIWRSLSGVVVLSPFSSKWVSSGHST